MLMDGILRPFDCKTCSLRSQTIRYSYLLPPISILLPRRKLSVSIFLEYNNDRKNDYLISIIRTWNWQWDKAWNLSCHWWKFRFGFRFPKKKKVGGREVVVVVNTEMMNTSKKNVNIGLPIVSECSSCNNSAE